VINTNLHPTLHRFQVMTDYWVKFSLARAECLILTLSLGVIPANIVINDISLKTRFFGLHFCCRKYLCIFNHFYIFRPESSRIPWNYSTVRSITLFKVIVTEFGTNQKIICDFLLVINTNLPPILYRFQDTASNRSKIAIFGYPSCV